MDRNIVDTWLHSLHLGQYAESFIDNGYDDLEICKQVSEPDLDAIGVFNPVHRTKILEAVQTLREEGGACVYFTLEESANFPCDRLSSEKSECSTKLRYPKPYQKNRAMHRGCVPHVCDRSARVRSKHAENYPKSTCTLLRISRARLSLLVKEKLRQDGVRIGCPPYTGLDGTAGDLDGLASRYADELQTHYQDVLEHLEEIRQLEWQEIAFRLKHIDSSIYRNPSWTPLPVSPSYVINSNVKMKQLVYTPGKYMPSSCLNEKDDEIYDWGYVYRNPCWKDPRKVLPSVGRYPKPQNSYHGDIVVNQDVKSENSMVCNRKISTHLANLFKTLSVKKKSKAVCCRENNVSMITECLKLPGNGSNMLTRSSSEESFDENLAADPLITPASPSMMLPSTHLKLHCDQQKISLGEALKKFKAAERERENSQIDRSSQFVHESSLDAALNHQPAHLYADNKGWIESFKFPTSQHSLHGSSTGLDSSFSNDRFYPNGSSSLSSFDLTSSNDQIRTKASFNYDAESRVDDSTIACRQLNCHSKMNGTHNFMASSNSPLIINNHDALSSPIRNYSSNENYMHPCCVKDYYIKRICEDTNQELKGKLLQQRNNLFDKIIELGKGMNKKIFRHPPSVCINSDTIKDKRLNARPRFLTCSTDFECNLSSSDAQCEYKASSRLKADGRKKAGQLAVQ